jgi:hypothetical protein
MKNKVLFLAMVRFLAGFCVNVAAAYFVGIFIAQDMSTLTERIFVCILTSYMAITLEMMAQRL